MIVRWRDLFSSRDVDDVLVEVAFVDLAERYGENGHFDRLSAGRFYHNLHHIESVLDHIQPFLPTARNPIALQLAAWFHDVVYDATRYDNEAQSGVYARQTLSTLGIGDDVAGEVARLILLTVGHETDTSAGSVQGVSDTDGHILLDADLAILAAEPMLYDTYAQAIRQEYAHVPDEAYRVGRGQVLQRLEERPFLYHLPEHQSWETAARANLTRELARLVD